MIRYVLLSALFLTALHLTGQTTFKKRFGTSALDRAWCIEVLPDNSFIVGGGSFGGGLGSEDALLVKFSAAGNVEWSRVYGGSGFDRFTKLTACSDGNFLAMGETNSMGAGNTDIYVLKFDGSGNVLWERTCGGSNIENARGICEVSSGYVVTGNTFSFGNGGGDVFVEKLDFNGNSAWSNAYGGNTADFSGEPVAGASDQIWVAAYTSFGGNSDCILLNLDANGTVIQTRRVGDSNNEIFYYLTPGGPGLVASGNIQNSVYRPVALGFSASGNLVWAKNYVIPGGVYDANLEFCPNGGLVFTPIRAGADEPNAYIVKTDDNGNISWARAYSFDGFGGRLLHVRPAPDGGYVAVGFCSSACQDIYVLKTDADGYIEGCCPMDAPITAENFSPASSTVSPSRVGGPASGTPSASNDDVTLTEISLCNGEGCCPTDAGTMLVQTLHACINAPAILTHNGDDTLDADDLLQFILFSDLADTLGSIIATSNTPTFTFNPATMQTGLTYYVAAIAGNNVGGNVDVNDPCFDISNAAELIWHPLPEVELQADNSDVCAGDCRTLTATLTGTPPFTLTVSSPAGTTTLTFQNNTGTFQICPPPGTPPGSFTVQATALTDAFCTCP